MQEKKIYDGQYKPETICSMYVESDDKTFYSIV